ncbi:MAG: IS5/IS1182 family transposase, partial [Candidatus Latescibacteria bacterium]|nr:IS5/IS1182 family transposase [Candidatus Latescibacterota bacterium]
MAIETSLTLGKLFHQPLRQTQGLVQSLLALMHT